MLNLIHRKNTSYYICFKYISARYKICSYKLSEGECDAFTIFIQLSILVLAFNQFDSYFFDLAASLRGLLIVFSFLPAFFLLWCNKKLSLSLIALSICLVLFHFKPYSSSEVTQNKDIKVAQVNLQYSNPNLANIITSQFINAQNDILVLFEFNDTQRHVLDELNTQYHLFGYAEVEGAPFGIIVLSSLNSQCISSR